MFGGRLLLSVLSFLLLECVRVRYFSFLSRKLLFCRTLILLGFLVFVDAVAAVLLGVLVLSLFSFFYLLLE